MTKSGVTGEGEGEVAFFSAKHWDRRNRADLIESTTRCHDAQVVGSYRDSNPLHLTVLAAMSEGLHHGATTPSGVTIWLHDLLQNSRAMHPSRNIDWPYHDSWIIWAFIYTNRLIFENCKKSTSSPGPFVILGRPWGRGR